MTPDLVPAQPATAVQKPSVPVRMGVAPTTLDEAWRMATHIANSDDMVAKAYRGAPAKVLVAIQMGMEIGLAPMQALQSIAVINGRAALWGDALLAVVIGSPAYQDHDEYYEVEVKVGEGKAATLMMERRDNLTPADCKIDTSCAVCTFIRRGVTPKTRRFSVAQARKAGYLGEGNRAGKEGPWQTHPDRMLAMRARSFAARDTFPDVLRGMRTAEEVLDIEADTVNVPLPAVPREVRRISEQPSPTPEPEPAPPPPPKRVGPVAVTRIEQLIGGLCAFLADGSQVWLTSEDDAKDLAKFIGTAHRLVFSVVPVDGAPQQQTAVSFELAE